MRKRLSWDKKKVAEIMKSADPYTMNQERTNPPVEKYQTGNPSTWGEDPNLSTPWKNEGRNEVGLPAPASAQTTAPAPIQEQAPAREAIVQARKLEDKALKCLTIAQRMLPGASDDLIEEQATDFMYLPERAIMATLQRQSDVATKIAAEMEKEEKVDEEETKDKKDPTALPVKAGKECEPHKEPDGDEAVGTPAAAPAKTPEKTEEEKKPVQAEEKKPEEPVKKVEEKKVPEASDTPEAPEAVKEASDKDLLDIIFDTAEFAPEPKMGAKKLSGLVKKASGEDPLLNLWDVPPDVSSVFKSY